MLLLILNHPCKNLLRSQLQFLKGEWIFKRVIKNDGVTTPAQDKLRKTYIIVV